MKKAFTLIILLGLAHIVAAQSVCWCRFEVTSQNKQYIASIAPADHELKNPNWKTDWSLKVYQVKDGSKKLIWQSKYTYSGKPTGTLSDDGQYFTYVEDWYYKNMPLLIIYKNGQKIVADLDGKALLITRRKLKRTPLHYLWLSQLDTPYQYKRTVHGQTYLVLRTIDDREFTVDLDNGTFREKS